MYSLLTPFFQTELWRQMAGAVVFLSVAFFVWYATMRWARQVRAQIEALVTLSRSSNNGTTDPATEATRASELDSARRRLTALRMITNAARYVLGAAVLLSLLRVINVPLDGLLLPAGFLGAALGLGAQSLVRDFVSGLFVVFEGQFAVGDTVTINDKTGVVDEIGLRVTRIRDESGTLFYFPNGAMTSVAKFPRRDTELIISIPLAEGTDAEAAATLAHATIVDFGEHFNATQGPIRRAEQTDGEASPTPPDDTATPPTGVPPTGAPTLVFAVPLKPTRLAVAREKLPPRLTAALDAAGHKLRPGAEVGSFIAPPH
jgi:small-conductance mechanosensitive channel